MCNTKDQTKDTLMSCYSVLYLLTIYVQGASWPEPSLCFASLGFMLFVRRDATTYHR